MGAIPASTLVICAVPDFVTWAVGHLSAVSDDPHQLCQAGRYFSSEKVNIKSDSLCAAFGVHLNGC